ncbi:heme peroxidase [Obba rivulosa]|uniref:Heme peroxidase n=1 Tax=Obba rivulosa TaxID=1052685 RepID=A0A8E2DIP6_9APHY|nr:heme peroxidase [Obba rivulosa]
MAVWDILLHTAESYSLARRTGYTTIYQKVLAITPGDFIQFAVAMGFSNCPGAPQLQFMLGRPMPVAASLDGLIPEPFDAVDSSIERFADAGNFTPSHIIWLLNAHSVVAADEVDSTIPGTPFDSTPFILTVSSSLRLSSAAHCSQGENQGEVESPIMGELHLQSDSELPRDNRTACEWQSFVNNLERMQTLFPAAMATMAVIGQDTSQMVDCSDVVHILLLRALGFEPNVICPQIPITPPPQGTAHFPAGLGIADVEQACSTAMFPTLPTDPGPATYVAPVPPA